MLTSKKILALTVAVTATGIAADTFAGFDGTTAAAGARAFGVVNDQYAAGEYARSWSKAPPLSSLLKLSLSAKTFK